MDWDFAFEDYFTLSKEQRENYIFFITKYYIDLMVNKNDEILFLVSIEELMRKVKREQKKAVNDERYEEAEIYKLMFKEMNQIKNTFKNVQLPKQTDQQSE